MEFILIILNSVAHFFTSPLNTFFLLVFAAVLLKWRYTRSSIPLWLSGLALFFLLLCSLPMTSHMMLRPLEAYSSTVKKDDSVWMKAEAIVVLGCKHYEDPDLPFADNWHHCSLTRNLQAAVMYLHQPKTIYTSGGVLKKRHRSESDANKAFLVGLGIPEKHVKTVATGTNTAEEAQALSAILRGKSVALVTSASHQRRAGNYFRQKGIQVIPVPVDYLTQAQMPWGWPSAEALNVSQRAIYEWLALVKQKLE